MHALCGFPECRSRITRSCASCARSTCGGLFRRTGRPDVIYLASPATLGLQLWLQVRHLNIPVVANFQTDLATYAA